MGTRRRTGTLAPRTLLALAALVVAGGPALGLAQGATPVGPAGGAGCTAGSSGIGDDYFPLMGNAGYDVQRYDLDLDLDVRGGAIADGRARISALATLPLCAFNLELAGLSIEAVTVDGQAATYERRGTELTVAPAAPIAAGADFVVEVVYRGTPGRPAPAASPEPAAGPEDEPGRQYGEGWTTGPDLIFVAGQPNGAETWYPVNGHPADKATYGFRLTVPKPFEAAANGVLAETIDEGAATTFVWAARDPMASYLVTLHAGELEIEEAVGPNGLPIRNVFGADVPRAQRDAFGRFPEMIAYFETVFGPYPFEVAGNSVVGLPLGFALETQTLSTFGVVPLPPGVTLPPEAVAQIEQVVAHELAHQWYGDSVTLLRWGDLWLHEGFATYAQALWLEGSEGPAARDEQLAEIYRGLEAQARFQDPATLGTLNAADVLAGIGAVFGQEIPEEFARAYRGGLGAASDAELAGIAATRGLEQLAALGVPPELFPGTAVLTGDPGPDDLFSFSAVYQRGALTLHALRREVGDDAFFATLRGWTDRYRNGNATTEDFLALAEETSGRDLDPLFADWLEQAALPPLTFETRETGTAEATPVGTPGATPVAR